MVISSERRGIRRRLVWIVSRVNLELGDCKGVRHHCAAARLIRIEHEFVISYAVNVENLERRNQDVVLVIVRSLVIKRETTIGVVSLFGSLLLDSQKRVDVSGTGRLLIGLGE